MDDHADSLALDKTALRAPGSSYLKTARAMRHLSLQSRIQSVVEVYL